jgi:hypothetical protein
MGDLTFPVTSLLQLFRNAFVSRQGRRQQFFGQTIEREFQDIKHTHDIFRDILTALKHQLSHLPDPTARGGMLLAIHLRKTLEDAEEARQNNRTVRRELYEGCKAFLEIANPFENDVILVLDDTEIREVKLFMTNVISYFEINNVYRHNVSRVLRNLGRLFGVAIEAVNSKRGLQETISGLTAYVKTLDYFIDQNEINFGQIARQYARLRFLLSR